MKIALVHDWLTGMRGGEKCLMALLQLYPQADLYTLIHTPGLTDPSIDNRVSGASFLQRLPAVRRYYRALLPLFPSAARSLPLKDYDLVISLSHAAAKNVEVSASSRHICYCFTPMRYIWDQAQAYSSTLSVLGWPCIQALRNWDRRSRVTEFIGISRFIAARIRCFYKRRAEVIYPPVDTSWISPAERNTKGVAFLFAGALVPYKRPDLVIQAFNQLNLPLWIVGKGPMEKYLRKIAGPQVHFFGHVSDTELASIYRSCRALVYPGVEDFGMVPVECLAAGRPVIGVYAGGLKETLTGLKPWSNSSIDASQATGVFIHKGQLTNTEGLIDAIQYFLSVERELPLEDCVQQAKAFSPERFVSAWNQFADLRGIPVETDRVLRVAHA